MAEQKISILISADPSGAISGLRMVGTETEKLASSTKSFTEKMRANWVEFAAGITAAYFAIQKVWGLAEGAANFQESMTVLNALTKQYGTSAEGMVKSISDAADGMISMKDAATVAGGALVKGFTPQQLTQLAQLSVIMSRLSGGATSAGEAFRSLAETMATGRERGAVKLLGTTIDLNAAYGAQAANMDKAQKMQAIINLALEQGARVMATLGTHIDSTADKMKQFTVQVENLKITLGDVLLRISAGFMGTAQAVSAAVSLFAGILLAPIQALAMATDYLGITKGKAKEYLSDQKAMMASAEDLIFKAAANFKLAKGSMIVPGSAAGPPLPPPGDDGNLKAQEKINEILRQLAHERELIDAAEKDKELVNLNFWFDEQVKKLRALGASDADYSALVRTYAAKRHDDVASQATKTADFYIAEQRRMSEEAIKIQKEQIDAMLKEETFGAETRLKIEKLIMESTGATPLDLIKQQSAGQQEVLSINLKYLGELMNKNEELGGSYEDLRKYAQQYMDVLNQIDAIKKSRGAELFVEGLKADATAQITIFNTSGIAEYNLAIDEATNKVNAFKDVWKEAHKTIGMSAVELGMSVRDGLVGSLSSVIMGAKTAGEAFKELGKTVLKMIVDTLLKWVINRTIMAGLEAMFTAEQVATTTVAAGIIGAAWVGPAYLASVATLGGADAEGLAALAAGMAAAAGLLGAMKAVSIGEGLSPGIDTSGAAFASGTDYVPRTMPALVHEGERILTPDQNKDFTEFLKAGGAHAGGGDIHLDGFLVGKWLERRADQYGGMKLRFT